MCSSTPPECGYVEAAPTISARAHKEALQRIPRKSNLASGAGSRGNSPVPDSCYNEPRRVSFGGVSSTAIPRRDSFSTKQKKSMWYNEEELDRLRTKVKMVICEEVDLDESEDCWRGLECYIHQQIQRASGELTEQQLCNQIMLHLWQMEHKMMGPDERSRNLEALAHTMKQEATESGEWLAAEDELEAYKIYMEDMDASLVMACFQN